MRHMYGERRLAHTPYSADRRYRHALGQTLGGQQHPDPPGDRPAPGEVADRGGELGRAGEIAHGLLLGGLRRLLRGRGGQGGIGVEDALVQGGELGPWLDAQFLDQRVAGLGEDVERVALPAAPVVGEHQLGAQALAERVVGGERDQFGDHRGVAAEFQVDVHQDLDGADLRLDQAVALVFGVGSDGSGEQFALAAAQRGAERGGGRLPPSRAARGLGLGDALFEEGQVEGARGQAQRVAPADGGEQFGARARGAVGFQDGAEAGDVGAQGAEGTGRRVLAPDRVDHFGGGDRVALAQEEHRENRALQRGAQVQFLAVAPGADGAEHGEPQPAFDSLTSHSLCLLRNGSFYDQMIGPPLLVT